MKKVLIVDDEENIVDLVSIVGEHQPDVMIARLDSLELCRRVRSNPTTSHTPIILITAAQGMVSEDCRADEVIRKPFDIFSLARTVERFLS